MFAHANKKNSNVSAYFNLTQFFHVAQRISHEIPLKASQRSQVETKLKVIFFSFRTRVHDQ